MADLRLRMAGAAEEWRQRGAQAVPVDERDVWVAQYFELLAFLNDLSIPFTNNQAERDLRMVSRPIKDRRNLS